MHLEANKKERVSVKPIFKTLSQNYEMSSNLKLPSCKNYFILEGNKKDPSIYIFKEERLPYDVNMTQICRQPNRRFTFSLLFGERSENRPKNYVTRTLAWVGRVRSGIWVGRNAGDWSSARHEYRLIIGQEVDSRDSRKNK